jgi:glycosyltransferase involved in cell wall biosynthesis
MRRVAIIAPDYYPATCGVGDHSMRLASELARNGIEVAVFTRQPAVAHPEAPHVPVFGVPAPTPLLATMPLLGRLLAWRPVDAILQYTPPMLGSSRFGSPAAVLLVMALRRAGIRVTVVAHELFVPWSLRPDMIAAAAAHRVILLGLLAAADRFIVTTGSRLDDVHGLCRGFERRLRVSVVPVGSNVIPVPAWPEPGRFRVGQFSTFNASKRFDVLLDAFVRIGAVRPEAELVLVGQLGSDGSRRGRRLRDAIAAHPLAARIRVTGALTLPEVAKAVASLNVYMFPMDTGATTRSGTLPVALGCGVPVVAARGRETSSMFVADENVVFAESLTGEGFAAATLRIASDQPLAARVAAGGRRFYEERLAWNVITPAILS